MENVGIFHTDLPCGISLFQLGCYVWPVYGTNGYIPIPLFEKKRILPLETWLQRFCWFSEFRDDVA